MPLSSLLSGVASVAPAASSVAAAAATFESSLAAASAPTIDDINRGNTAAEIVSWISLICLIPTLISYVGFRAKRHFPTRLPAYVIACSILYTISMLMGVYHAPCGVQGALMYYSGFALWIWSTIICANFYFSLNSGAVAADLEGQERTYNAVAWGVPFVFLFFALVFDKTDSHRAGGRLWYCFVATESSVLVQSVLFYSWFLVAAVIALFFWPVSLYRLYQSHRPQLPSAWAAVIHVAGGRYMRFMFFFCFYFAALFAIRIIDSMKKSDGSTVMTHSLITTSAGFCVSAIFFCSWSNLARWGRVLRRKFAKLRVLCCCCCSSSSRGSSRSGDSSEEKGWWANLGALLDGAEVASDDDSDGEDDEAPDDEMFDEIYGVSLFYQTHPGASAAANGDSLNSSSLASKRKKSKGRYVPPSAGASEGAVVLVPDAPGSSWGRSATASISVAAAATAAWNHTTGTGAGAGAGGVGSNDGQEPAMFPGSLPASSSSLGSLVGSSSSVGRSVLQEANTKTYFHHYDVDDAAAARPVVEKVASLKDKGGDYDV